MKYYSNYTQEVFAYPVDGSQDHLIGEKRRMTDEEVEALLNPTPTKEQRLSQLNQERDTELKNIFIDGILCTEELLKTMSVKYAITSDVGVFNWINVNNETVTLSKEEFGLLIAQGVAKVEEIYFRYRRLKDEVLEEELQAN